MGTKNGDLRHRPRALAALAAALVAMPHAHATPQSSAGSEPPALSPIVLEAHVGDRSSDAAAALRPVLDELERRGYAARPETIGSALGGHVPRPGILDSGKTAADIAQEIETGLALFHLGKFRDSEVALALAVRHIKRNPSLVVLDTTNEKSIFNAFVGLAMSQAKLNRTSEAMETMAELQRMSSTPIDRSEYGPQAEQIYRSSQKRTQATSRGSLKITVNEPRAMIFLDSRYRGLGKMSLGDVIPGSHSVLIQMPGTEGRQYEIEVRANEASALNIDWPVDSTLHISEPWAGLSFATELEREQEAVYATELARRWARRSIIVVGRTRLNGVSVILGVVYPASGEPSGAFVPLSSGEKRLRDLARFLFDGTVGDGVNVLESGRPSIASTSSLSAPDVRRSALLAKVVTGAGVLAIAAGGVVYAASQEYDYRTADTYVERREPALYVMLGGSIAFGGGAYLWLRESRSASILTSGILGAGVASMAAGVELYLTDEDPLPTLPPVIRDSATHGVIIGASGVALTGLGLWLLHRETTHASSGMAAGSRRADAVLSWAPTVSIAPSYALVGCAGSFR